MSLASNSTSILLSIDVPPPYTSLDLPSSPPPTYTTQKTILSEAERHEVEAEVRRKNPSRYGAVPPFWQRKKRAELEAWERAQSLTDVEAWVQKSMVRREVREMNRAMQGHLA